MFEIIWIFIIIVILFINFAKLNLLAINFYLYLNDIKSIPSNLFLIRIFLNLKHK